MISILTFIFFVFGLIIGSFLNVVVYRFNTEKPLGGRSACMTCRSKLSWHELVPLFSFLALKGRCKSCQSKISRQYPLVELGTGIIFGLLFYKFYNLLFDSTLIFSVAFAYYAVIFSILIVIATYDIKHKIIPDSLSLTLGVLAFIGIFFFNSNIFWGGTDISGFYFNVPSFLALISGLIISIPFALLWLVSGGRWMGLGDAKLAVGLGLLLGFPAILYATMLSFWIGAIIGIMLILISKKYTPKSDLKYKMKSEIPFAPYLIIGTLLVFFLNSCLTLILKI